MMTLGVAQAENAAEPAEPPMFSVSGFGTLGAVHSSEKKADYVANDAQARGAGLNGNWSAEVDSRLGVQLTARFTPKLTGVVQVTSEQRSDGSYKPEFEWANLKYQLTPDFSVRAGRVVLSNFLVSDYRLVGYANPWGRPPVEVYSLVPIKRSDGLDFTYRLRTGEFNHTLQGGVGANNTRLPEGKSASFDRGWIVSDTVERGPLTVHVSYAKATLDVKGYDALFDGFRRFGAQGQALAAKYDVRDKLYSTFGLGAIYDPGNWFLMGEYSLNNSRSMLGKRAGWYGTAGYRTGAWTPYITYAQSELKSSTNEPGLSTSGLPAALAGSARVLNATLGSALTIAPVQKTVALGIRWDFAPKAALKLQYDHTKLKNSSPGTLNNFAPDFKPGGSFSVISATIDFLF